jgi:hypothetical protein
MRSTTRAPCVAVRALIGVFVRLFRSLHYRSRPRRSRAGSALGPTTSMLIDRLARPFLSWKGRGRSVAGHGRIKRRTANDDCARVPDGTPRNASTRIDFAETNPTKARHNLSISRGPDRLLIRKRRQDFRNSAIVAAAGRNNSRKVRIPRPYGAPTVREGIPHTRPAQSITFNGADT